MSSDGSGTFAGWDACEIGIAGCTADRTIFQYRPSLAANALFIALFGISGAFHAYQGFRYRQWLFAELMVVGCICEIIGYGGRIIMYNDPWSFMGFIMQIVCITIAPVFFTAAIYVTLYKSVHLLSESSALFKPAFYYQIFIPCDIVSLILQSVGGAMSAQSNGPSQAGVDIGLTGLSFQVLTLLVFSFLAVNYAVRFRKDVRNEKVSGERLDRKFTIFVTFLSIATILIFIRCAYRIYELSKGYSGPALHNEAEFMSLESLMVVLAVFALHIGHPGPVFTDNRPRDVAGGEAGHDEAGKSWH